MRWGLACIAVPSGACWGRYMPPLHLPLLLFQLLARLLKSKNPDDLQEANRLIKSMVKEVSGLGFLGGRTDVLPQRSYVPLVHPAPTLSCREFRRSLVFPMGGSIAECWVAGVVEVGGVTLKQLGVSLRPVVLGNTLSRDLGLGLCPCEVG